MNSSVVCLLTVDGSNSRKRVHHCPTCDADRDMVVTFEPFHGATTHCTGCGYYWPESREPVPDPLFRYPNPVHDTPESRPSRIAWINGLWQSAITGPNPTDAELYGDMFEEEGE